MNDYIAALVLLTLVAFVWVLLERTHHRTAALPRAPFGADLEGDADLARLRHDLDVGRHGRLA